MPFFAVVGGPVLAWNLQDFFVRRAATVGGGRPRSGYWLLSTRALTAGLGLAVLVSAWPGWLQAPPFEPRRWAVETAPRWSARRWNREGRLGPHSRAMHLSPDTAHAFAWFCPEDRGVLSARIAPGDGSPEQWVARMRDEGITHAIVYDSNRDRLFAALEQFLADPGQWPLLRLESDVAVFGWRDPARTAAGDPFRGWEVDLNRLARAEEELAPVVQAEQDNAQAYAAEASGARVLDRAMLAMGKGLAGKARDVLLASDVAAFGPQGMAMELELLTMTGRVQEVREWMTAEHEASLGEGNYRWLRILASAAAGDYATADADLAYLAGAGLGAESHGPRDAITLAVGKAVLDDRPGERLSFAGLGSRISGPLEFRSRLRSSALALSQRADVTVLRGLLALEVGEVDDAKAAFRQALTYWDADSRTGVDFNGRGIARDGLEWLE